MTLEAQKNPRDIILRPVVTEKSSLLQDEGKYTFEVDPRANKPEIKQAIEEIFDVKVAKVATQRRKGKQYLRRDGVGKRRDVKRAIVTLRDGSIDVFGGAGI